jgi:hypothetical protein
MQVDGGEERGIETLNEKKRQQKLQVINQIFDIINKINDE